MAKGGLAFIKYITFFCNLLFVITGLLILIVGATIHLNYPHYSKFADGNIWTTPVILIKISIIVTGICFLGCCGVVRENKCMTTSFIFLATILVLVELSLGILGYIHQHEVLKRVEDQLNNTIDNYNHREDYRDVWSLVQTELKCCGLYSPLEWNRSLKSGTLPPSCCVIINLSEANECTLIHANAEGCLTKMLTALDLNMGNLLITVAIITGLQILTILFACCLQRSFCRSYEAIIDRYRVSV